MYKVKELKNETFTIDRIEDMVELPNMAAALVKSGKEPKRYWMKRQIEGTRKKPYTVPCWRFAGTDTFITMI